MDGSDWVGLNWIGMTGCSNTKGMTGYNTEQKPQRRKIMLGGRDAFLSPVLLEEGSVHPPPWRVPDPAHSTLN